MRSPYKSVFETLARGAHLETAGIDERIILINRVGFGAGFYGSR
jgi:hypothetical protein